MNERIPKHVVIIPDGNRRWAKRHGLHPWKGHEAGAERFKDLMEHFKDSGMKILTTWGWSTENWKRDPKEIDMIMKLFVNFLKKEKKCLIDNKVQFRHFGRKDRLPKNLVKEIEKLERETRAYEPEFYYNAALDYGGRDEILRAVKRMVREGVDFEKLDEEMFSSYLDTAGLPNPDLIIRTSGEQRLSGIMPWQGIYAELYFAQVDFPDFTADEFDKAFDSYAKRERRFGGMSKKYEFGWKELLKHS